MNRTPLACSFFRQKTADEPLVRDCSSLDPLESRFRRAYINALVQPNLAPRARERGTQFDGSPYLPGRAVAGRRFAVANRGTFKP